MTIRTSDKIAESTYVTDDRPHGSTSTQSKSKWTTSSGGHYASSAPQAGSSPGQSILSQFAWRTIAESLQLSHREFQIARALFDDEKELCIARKLGISKHTVNTYLQRLYQKLHVSSRVQLVVRLVGEHLA